MTRPAMPRIIPFPMLAVPERATARNDLAASAACLSAALNCLSVALADQQAATRPRNTTGEAKAATKAKPRLENPPE